VLASKEGCRDGWRAVTTPGAVGGVEYTRSVMQACRMLQALLLWVDGGVHSRVHSVRAPALHGCAWCFRRVVEPCGSAVCAAVVGRGATVSYLHRYQNDAVLRVEVCKGCAHVYFGVRQHELQTANNSIAANQ
jgi:hypothetical protein